MGLEELLIDISSGTSIRSDSKQFSEKRAQEQKNTFDEFYQIHEFVLSSTVYHCLILDYYNVMIHQNYNILISD